MPREGARARGGLGPGTVATFTLNHQPWVPAPDHPYAIAIVEIDEQAGVRLMTNVVGCAPEEVRIGMPVRVRLRAARRRLDPALRAGRRAEWRSSSGAPRSPASASRDVGRRLGRDPLELTLDACLAAIADAGLTRATSTASRPIPGAWRRRRASRAPGVTEVHDALRLELDWYTGGIELPGQLGSVIDACVAVATGLATHVLCFRSVWEGTAQGRAAAGIGGGARWGRQAAARGGSMLEWTLPFRAYSAANWIAMFAQRHFHEYGTTREQLAWIALNARRNAARQPEGDLPRAADARRLPRRAHDHARRSACSTATCPATARPR